MGNYQSADKTKDHAMHGLLFCWIPAGGAERPLCENKRGISPVSNERCKRRRSSATIANCNTYSPHPVRNSRGTSGLKARSFRSFAYRFSAALTLPLAARRSVMSQVKRCAQAGSSTGEWVIARVQTKQKTMHCMVFCFVGFRRLPTLPDRRQSSTIGV